MNGVAPQVSPVSAVKPSGPDRKKWVLDRVSEFAMVAVLVIVVVAAAFIEPRFLSTDNFKNILTQNAPVGLVAIGMTFVLIGGGFDLSVGGIFALAGVLYADLAGSMPTAIAFVLMLAIAAFLGAANGLVITKLNVNAFVATLGSGSIFTGFAYLVASTGSIAVEKTSFFWLGGETLLGIRVTIWILALVFIVAGLVLAKSVYGRSVYVVGGNVEAARLSGMRVGLAQTSTFVLAALGAAVGGMLLASETHVGQSNVGTEITLDAIAIVIIGGTPLRGGQGAMWRTLVGFLIVGSVSNLLSLMALNSAIQSIAKGSIIILAVAIDAAVQRRRAAG
jgi:ribose transport system permease protein